MIKTKKQKKKPHIFKKNSHSAVYSLHGLRCNMTVFIEIIPTHLTKFKFRKRIKFSSSLVYVLPKK